MCVHFDFFAFDSLVILQKFKLHIEDPPRRKNLVFLGASVLGGIMENRPDFWVTKEEYQEHGGQIAAKRFSRGN